MSLSVAYNPSVASPFEGVFSDHGGARLQLVEKQTRNPWAGKMPVQRGFDEYVPPERPVLPNPNAPRYITDEELEALNRQSERTMNGSSMSHGWEPLPPVEGMKEKEQQSTQAYTYPYGGQYGGDLGVLPNQYQWGDGSAVLPMGDGFGVLPVDPMDPGKSGMPFGGPFENIDSFVYE